MAKLIYQAGFYDGQLNPLVDELGIEALQLVQAPGLPGAAAEKMEILSSEKARFTVDRIGSPPESDLPSGEKKDDCYVGAVVNRFPDKIKLFKIRATFEMPEWKSIDPVDYKWAMAVFARKGAVAYDPRRKERTTVTLQAVGDHTGIFSAQMNTVGGSALDDPKKGGGGDPIPHRLYAGIFESKDPSRSRLTIELLIDREGEIARAGLEARLYYLLFWVPYRERRWFIHPLITGDEKGPIDSVGFAIANANGAGTASATIRDFRIYSLSFFDIWIVRVGALIAKIGALFSRR